MIQTNKNITITYGDFDDLDLPPIVYKYRNWSNSLHQRFLTHREVFLASPKTFDDQLDCYNPTRFDLLTKDQIYEYFIWRSKEENIHYSRQQHRKFARYWSKYSAVNNPKIVQEYMVESIKQYHEHEGILSLTENCSNERLWQEYAEDHKGFCIGYNARIMFEYLGGGGPVTYCDELPIILPEPFMEFGEAILNQVYCKLKKYSYEEEYRTKKFWPNTATIEDRQIQLPKEAYNKIILGKNISQEDMDEIIFIVKEKIGNIEIVIL